MAEKRLYDELDIWAAEGWAAPFWWRDDDLEKDSDAFSRLLDLSWRADCPVMLAVIPETCEDDLGEKLSQSSARVALHGYSHRSHAGPGEKKSELPQGRSLDDRIDDLRRGHAKLSALFGAKYCPTLVPPWNRIGSGLPPHLPAIGLSGLSTFKPRPALEPVAGLVQINTHVDVIDWKGERDFIGVDQVFRQIADHLAAKRKGLVDDFEPTGILTHHLIMTEPGWQGLETVLRTLGSHDAVRFEPPGDLFPPLTEGL